MKKRLLKCVFAMAALALLGFLAPSLYWRCAGLVRGEAFYAGRPTSYWRGYVYDDEEHRKRLVRDLIRSRAPTWPESMQDWKERWFGRNYAVGGSMRTDPNAIPVLLELLPDHDSEIHRFAFERIVKQCETTRSVLHRLVDHMMSQWRPEYDQLNPGIRLFTYIALHNECGKDAAPHFLRWVNHSDEDIASEATIALGLQGEDAMFAIPVLIGKLNRENDFKASEALAAIGPAALPALKVALNGDDRHARLHATNALAKMSPAWRNASDWHAVGYAERTTLLELLTTDADPGIQAVAKKGLLSSGPPNRN